MKILKRLVLLMALVVPFALIMTACGTPQKEHTHDYSEAWKSNEIVHWHECECGARDAEEHDLELKNDATKHWCECTICGVKIYEANHSGGKAGCGEKAECVICGVEYGEPGSHVYTIVKADENGHWYECVCGAKGEVADHVGGRATCSAQAVCKVCGESYGDTTGHNFVELEANADGHWYICSVCGDDGEVIAHEGGKATCTRQAKCSVCHQEYGELAEHNYTILKANADGHWYVCPCGAEDELVAHEGGEATCGAQAVCDVCEKSYGETPEHNYTEAGFDANRHYIACECGDTDKERKHFMVEVVETKANGDRVKYEKCEGCEYKTEETIIVEELTETTATLGGDSVTAITGDANVTADMSFDEVVTYLYDRTASGKNTKSIKTTVNGTATMGIAVSGNIVLTEDMVIGYNGNSTMRLLVTEDMVIDLNGYTLSQMPGTNGVSGYALIRVMNGATLTIIDSSEAGTGCISGVMSAIQVDADSTVNMYGGTVKCAETMTKADAKPSNFCVYTVATYGGTFNLYGGTVTTVATRPIRGTTDICTLTDYNFALATYGEGEINLYGGEVIGTIDDYAVPQITDYRDLV